MQTSFFDEVCHHPPNNPLKSRNWDEFQSIIRRPKPQKAAGLINLNLLVSICPEFVRHDLFALIHRVWNTTLPSKWLEKVLLPKDGDLLNPTNCHPIGVLASVY